MIKSIIGVIKRNYRRIKLWFMEFFNIREKLLVTAGSRTHDGITIDKGSVFSSASGRRLVSTKTVKIKRWRKSVKVPVRTLG